MILTTKHKLPDNYQNNKAKHKPSLHLTSMNAWLLWACQCLNISIIAIELSPWMFGLISLSLAWQALLLSKFGINNKKVKNKTINKTSTRVSPVVLGIFALLGCLAIVVTAKEVGVLVSMLHLLCFSYALKAFELKLRSDFYQLLLLGIFVIASSLIFRQDLLFSLITLLLLIVNFVVLLQFFSSQKKIGSNIKVICLLVGQSMVLAIVLFLVFPRLSPFWQVPSAQSAETGLSDTVRPGDIANLSRSTKLAFRVDFKQQNIPAYSQLYWRAMVLEKYDGKQWTRQKKQVKKPLDKHDVEPENNVSINTDNAASSPITYQVIAEPSFQRYLFALAPAKSVGVGSKSVVALTDYTFQSTQVITQTKAYQLTSYLDIPLSLQLSRKSKQLNLSYPKGSNPRLEQLALKLQRDHSDAQNRANAILALINKQNYAYTLQPPKLLNNSLDQFFFDTKSGFCAHYASAFTFLMRASGVPARMVTGYLGGEYNDSNRSEQSEERGHLSIYQYDAHAWAEIWIKGKGWVRVDPTGAVDPERVNSGWSTDLLKQQSNLSNDLFSLYQFKNSVWLNGLRLQFDALDYQWTRWVIGFTTDQQVDLLKRWFGNMLPWKLALIIASALMVSMVILMFILSMLNRTKTIVQVQPKWQQLYNKALTKLSKEGVVKPLGMTANDFAKHVREQMPTLAISFTRFNTTYNSLCYRDLSKVEQDEHTLLLQKHYQQFTQLLNKLNTG